MHLSAFQMKTDIVGSIQMTYLLLSALLEVWIFLRSVGRIFDNNLLKPRNCFISLGVRGRGMFRMVSSFSGKGCMPLSEIRWPK